MHLRDDMEVIFAWRRHRLFDRMSVVVLFERCLTARIAKVTKLQKKPTSKWRPLPLTTVELQKLGSMYLRMDSHRVMKVLSVRRPSFSKSITYIFDRSLRACIPKAGSVTHALKPIHSTRALIYELS